jgi:hypothetical protein
VVCLTDITIFDTISISKLSVNVKLGYGQCFYSTLDLDIAVAVSAGSIGGEQPNAVQLTTIISMIMSTVVQVTKSFSISFYLALFNIVLKKRDAYRPFGIFFCDVRYVLLKVGVIQADPCYSLSMGHKKLFVPVFALAMIITACMVTACRSNDGESVVPATEYDNPLRDTVEYLCAADPPRNYYNPASLERTARWIEARLLECTPFVKSQPFQADNGLTYENVIATFNPGGKDRIVVGAHYDVCGDQPGADDNASAVAGLIEIARLIARNEPALQYRVDLVAYSLEEPPTFRSRYMGSYIHAKSLHDAGIDIKVMICLEMIGYYSDRENSQRYPAPFLSTIYPTTGNFISVVGKMGQGRSVRRVKKLMKAGSDIPVQAIAAPPGLPGIDRSDHLNYWKFGYTAVMITDTADYRNPNYHQKSDTPDTLDYSMMAKTVASVYNTVIKY